MFLGNYLRVIRKAKKITAQYLATLCNRSHPYITKVELGSDTLSSDHLSIVLRALDQEHNTSFFRYQWFKHLTSIRVSMTDPRVPESLKILVALHEHGNYPNSEEFEAFIKQFDIPIPKDIEQYIRDSISKS